MENPSFTEKLIGWYTVRKRDLPWRSTQDPYKIWLSEIILQQTRVEQGLPYYHRFTENYPTIQDLSEAPEEEVLRCWQGLGYYSRARNLHSTAKFITQELGGVFPDTYEEILKLKGVGPYTAAAIASFCFGAPTPVVDGNVFRFASRVFGIREDIAKARTRSVFERTLTPHIKQANPGTFNQAMMEFGATVCAPKPLCEECVFLETCIARKEGIELTLPIKGKKVKTRDRHFHYLVVTDGESYLMNKRPAGDVWTGLYDFPLLEGDYDEESLFHAAKERLASEFLIEEVSETLKHILSHQVIKARFYTVSVDASLMKLIANKSQSEPYSLEEILNLPKPKLIVNYFHQIGIES